MLGAISQSYDPFTELPVEQDHPGYDLQARAATEKSGRRLDGHGQSPKVILGASFADGIEAVRRDVQAAAA